MIEVGGNGEPRREFIEKHAPASRGAEGRVTRRR